MPGGVKMMLQGAGGACLGQREEVESAWWSRCEWVVQ
jgi:hypothetical protein